MATSSAVSSFKWDLMISYSWAQQNLVTTIKRKLGEKGFNIWFDTEQMAGYDSLPEAMGDGISDSAAIILCISSDYENSNSCKKEAHFASSTNKPLFFIKVVENYTPSEKWLRFLMGDSLYFEMETMEKIEINFDQLKSAVCRVVMPKHSETKSVFEQYSKKVPYREVEELVDYGELEFDSFKKCFLQFGLYAVHNDDDKKLVKYQFKGTQLTKQQEVLMGGGTFQNLDVTKYHCSQSFSTAETTLCTKSRPKHSKQSEW